MKFLNKLFIYIVIIIAVVAFLYFKAFPSFSHAFDKIQEVSGTIEQQSSINIEQLQSASLVKEFIFPYDFISKPDVNWALINLKAASKQPLNIEEQALYKFSQAVLEAGFDLSRYPNSFFLITVKGSAGINLRGKSWFKVDDENSKKVFITLPPTEILSFEVIDGLPNKAHWPDVTMSPTAWAKLMVLLKPMMLTNFKESTLLTEAEENSKKIIDKAFFAAGFTDIIINSN